MSEKNTTHLQYAIVWSPLPPITWILPFIGHTGIADASGIVSDFQGPYSVGDTGHMAFGEPTRYVTMLDNRDCDAGEALRWNEAIQQANTVYRGRMHNLFCDNCHSHVAYALNYHGTNKFGVGKWDMVKLCWIVTTRGRFVSWGAVVKTYAPTVLLIALFVWLRMMK